ncbi:MAG TPA: S9 family peptidase [Steroidobacteraceae bacterium]|nr:S9 family peptidase [Steroidobacteraceae bacterium]
MIETRGATRLAVLTLVLLSAAARALADAGPFTVQDLVRIKRLSEPVVSPDGRYVVYTVRETDMEANRGQTDLWMIDLTAPGAEARRLTNNPANDSSPRWAPDARTLYFLSARSGSPQVWRLSLNGGEAQQVTSYPLDVGALAVSPRGDRIALTMEVLPECADLTCTHDRLAARGTGKPSGRLYERLFVRHWDSWSNGTRSHLFTARIRADGTAEPPVDVSAKLDADVPSKPFGSSVDFDFSPDGRMLVFSARLGGASEAWSTNFELFETPADGSGAPRNITGDNPAADTNPKFLANGALAYLAQERAGFESDRFHIVIRDARSGALRHLTKDWDRSVKVLGATPDGRLLLALVDDVGQQSLYTVDPESGARRQIVGQGQVTEFAASSGAVLFAHASLAAPPDLYSVALRGGSARRLTSVNAALLAARTFGDFEQFSFAGWRGEMVHAYLVKPVPYVAGQRYPLAFIIHGGPQSSMANEWSYRWNPQVFAGAGYAVLMIDFHGSSGYGQAFTDSISGDWGGKPLEDLQKGLVAALARYPWIEGQRVCALGASYGGYMINWIAGRWPDRFRCLVDHDGLFDQRSMYYSTDELWFPEWENGGPYFQKPQNYEAFNPADYVTAWRTPMLVIHGGLDFRVPLSQGLATFTALQRRGIESRLLYFPDENHWVLKPANSIQWYDTVLAWLDRHLK